MKKEVKNVAASVHARLLKLARERNEDFNLTLTKYILERFLYRLSKSKYRNQFVLKGALLFEVWTEQRYRPTRDADFLAHGNNNPDRLATIFREICVVEVDDDHDDDDHEEVVVVVVNAKDGCRFDPDSVKAQAIKESDDYEGVRITFLGYLGNAKIPIQADIGFGEAVIPAPTEADYPSMLDMPKPKLLTYPMVTSVAEKFEAMVKLGIANSRMKDIHDLKTMLKNFDFKGAELKNAIAATFERRKTALPTRDQQPLVFTAEFFTNDSKQKQWKAFVNKNRAFVVDETVEFALLAIRDFLMPIVTALSSNESFGKKWKAGGPWA